MSAVQPNHILSDLDAIETREWMDALSAVIEKEGGVKEGLRRRVWGESKAFSVPRHFHEPPQPLLSPHIALVVCVGLCCGRWANCGRRSDHWSDQRGAK